MGEALNLDFGNVVGFEPVPEGVYNVRVAEVKAGEKIKSKAGNPMIQIFYEIEDGDYKKKRLMENLTISEKSMWKVQEVLEALTGQDWQEDGMTLDPDELVGHSAKVAVVVEPHWEEAKAEKGVMVNKIDSYIKSGSGGGVLSLT